MSTDAKVLSRSLSHLPLEKQMELADKRTEALAARDLARHARMERKKAVQAATEMNGLRFFYYRAYEAVMDAYGRTKVVKAPRGGICVVARITSEGALEAAASICSPFAKDDSFDRLRAREVAIDRLTRVDETDRIGMYRLWPSSGGLSWFGGTGIVQAFIDMVVAQSLCLCGRKVQEWYEANVLSAEDAMAINDED